MTATVAHTSVLLSLIVLFALPAALALPPCTTPFDPSNLQDQYNLTLPAVPVYDDDDDGPSTLFKALSCDLHSESFFTYSITFIPLLPPPVTPTLVILTPSPFFSSQFLAIYLHWNLPIHCLDLCSSYIDHFTSQQYLHPNCNSHVLSNCTSPFIQDMEINPLPSSEAPLETNNFKDNLTLKYNASTGELRVEADRYQANKRVNISFTLSLDQDATSPPDQDATNPPESPNLFVGYIPTADTKATPAQMVEPIAHHDHMRLVWIILGTLLGATLVVGLISLVLLMKARNGKRLKARASLARCGAIPLARQPLRHDLEASEVPMMRSPPNYDAFQAPMIRSPPNYDAFQVSGTASWLKQPIPR